MKHKAKIHKDLGNGWYRTTTSFFNSKSTKLYFSNRTVNVLDCKPYIEQSDGITITVNKIKINDNPKYLEDFEIDV